MRTVDLKDLKLPESVTNFGLVGERKAISLLCLAFFAVVFSLMALIAAGQLPEWVACFAGLAVCYGIGFFALAADWFWGRWFAVGLGYSGVTMAIFALLQTREVGGPMMIFGVLHGLIAVTLLGTRMSAAYESRPDWKARWKLDDEGVLKVRRAVTRAASSLPGLIMFAFAPRDGGAALVALGAVGELGMVGLLRGRTWGLLVLGATGAGVIVSSLLSPPTASALAASAPIPLAWLGFFSGGLLLAASVPFLPRMLSFVANRRAA